LKKRRKYMEKIAKGKVFVFGTNIDTDQIYPGRYLELTDPKEVGKHALEGADPNLVKEFRTGDITSLPPTSVAAPAGSRRRLL
jgi:3-isopropylmalate dehydratase small subunit